MSLLHLRRVFMTFSIKYMLHERAIFDLAYPTYCLLSAIHDYNYCFLPSPTIDDTAQKHELLCSYSITLKGI
jgi:hypothetical protein